LALTGACTSFGDLDENLPKYVGKPVDLIVQRIGLPHGEVNVMNTKSYVWNSQAQGTFVIPTTTTGYVGTRPVQLTTYTPQTHHWACTLRIIVDAANIVTNWSYEGNNQACYTFSERLITDMLAPPPSPPLQKQPASQPRSG
jgi:hypothetical protein